MNSTDLPIIPFGKYKGKPITDLLADISYLEWCKQQEWFKKFPIIYNICINNTITNNTNSKTPEHNRIQNMFLKMENLICFIKYIYNNNKKTFKYKKQLFHMFDNEYSIDRSTEHYVEFESMFNWDVYIKGEMFSYFKLKENDCCGDERCKDSCYYDNDCNEQWLGPKFIEIKPIVGDDYPNILRKMKQQIVLTDNKLQKNKDDELKEMGYDPKTTKLVSQIKNEYRQYVKQIINNPSLYLGDYYLLIKDYESKITTKEQLINIFKQSNISVIFMDDIFKHLYESITLPNETNITEIPITSEKPCNITVDDFTRISQLEKRVTTLEDLLHKLLQKD